MDENQIKTLNLALSGHNILITGLPGSGKSHIISTIAKELKNNGKLVKVTASTGVASANLQLTETSTLHKFMGIRDGRYDNEQALNLLLCNENMKETLDEILKTDCLLIDEISMISWKTLQQVEFLLRKLKRNKHVFGGTQIILCGDFLQLPCIPNPHYNDNGKHCFHFEGIHNFHHIQLHHIHRQEEPDFIRAIHDVAQGCLSVESHNLIKRLKRNLPPGPEPVRLYAENLDVEIWNSEKLLEAEGDSKSYLAEDSGDVKQLVTVSAVKQLVIKNHSPVMLLVNLSSTLVNGLRGMVKEAKPDSIVVYFPTLNRQEEIKKHMFTVFSKKHQKDVASRLQIPLRLCYATTVHKAQGLTLDRVHVDCKKMFQSGQIAVALSRCKTKKGLRIVNFSKNLIRKPGKDVLEFYSRVQAYPKKNLSCCHSVQIDDTCTERRDSPTPENRNVAEYQGDSDADTEFDDEDDERMVSLLNNLDEVENLSDFEFQLPETVQVEDCLDAVKNKFTVTEHQQLENNAILELKKNSQTGTFVRFLWNEFNKLKTNILKEGEKIENKTISEFYRQVNEFITKDTYLLMEKLLFPNISQEEKNVLFKISTDVRKRVLDSYSETFRKATLSETGSEILFEDSPAGKGKIRYIGGWCIGKLLKVKRSSIKRILYKNVHKKNVQSLSIELDLLQHLCESEGILFEKSEEQESLCETARRQNLRKGLTNISDETYHFFLKLDKEIRKLESSHNIQLHGQNLFSFIQDDLFSNKSLHQCFENLLPPTAEKETVKKLMKDILEKYGIMSLSQVRRNYLEEMKIKKTEAHRKQIKMKKNKVGKDIFNFTVIKSDQTHGKIMSHRRLQSEILKDEIFLENKFTKAEIELLCKGYGVSVKGHRLKKDLRVALNKAIMDSETMMQPEILTSDGSLSVEEKLDKNTGGKGENHDEKTVMVTEPSTSKKHKTRGRQGKGKGKAKKSKKCSWPCGVCGNNCEEESVACDGCDTWYHFTCIHIEDETELEDEWYCNTCKSGDDVF